MNLNQRFGLNTTISRPFMLILMGFALLVICYGLFISMQKPAPSSWVTTAHSSHQGHQDLYLYQAITERVKAGEDYYPSALSEQRARGYPVKPFLTVRLPTLAEIRALTGISPTANTVTGLLFILAIALSWWARMRPPPASNHTDMQMPLATAIVAMLLLISGLTIYISGAFLSMHEVWAGGLLAVALALYRPTNPYPAMIAAALAVAIRETSLPFILLFCAYAAYHRRSKEMAIWAVIALLFCAALSWHAATVTALTRVDDLSSPGWGNMGGWATYLAFIHDSTILRFFPLTLTALLVPLSVAGWLGAKHVDGKLIFLFQAGYALIFMIMGRSDNYYWGFMVAPTLLMGLAFLPQLIADMRGRWTEAAISG